MSRLSGYGDEASAAAPSSVAGSSSVNPPDRDAAASINLREVELFKRAQAGDRGAFAQIVQLYQDRLFNAVLRMVGEHDDALELTQETFAKALEKIDSFRSEARPYTWLFRIAMNLSISELRKTRRRRTFTLSAGGNGRAEESEDQASNLMERVAQDRGVDPAQAAENRERHEQVLAALGRLDAEHRAILIMRDVEGFDYQQMADVLGLPLGTLKSRLFRARVALRDELRDYVEGKEKN